MSENENGRVFISEQSGVEVNRSGESDEKGEAGGPSKSGEAVISGKRSALGESGETGEICEKGETSECAKQGSTRSLPCREHSKGRVPKKNTYFFNGTKCKICFGNHRLHFQKKNRGNFFYP